MSNAEFHQGEADRLPVGDGAVDVVISNGVFNLCTDKPKVPAADEDDDVEDEEEPKYEIM